MRTLILFIAIVAASPVAAAGSITGTWAYPGASCTGSSDNKVIIGARSISGSFACTFTSVRRQGSTVRWQGTCYGPDGDTRGPGEMVARLAAGRLTLSGFGLGAGPLKRC
jgi:hypothetical protein